jgi:hypothetical protein
MTYNVSSLSDGCARPSPDRTSVCSPAVAEDDAPLDLDRVVDEIRAAVAARTASGEYSASLDDELRSRVVASATADPLAEAVTTLHALLAEVDASSVVGLGHAQTSSSVPGGAFVHRAAGRVVARQLSGLTDDINAFSASLVPALHALAALTEEGVAGDALRHEVDTVQDRLAELERSVRHVHGMAEELVATQRALALRVGLEAARTASTDVRVGTLLALRRAWRSWSATSVARELVDRAVAEVIDARAACDSAHRDHPDEAFAREIDLALVELRASCAARTASGRPARRSCSARITSSCWIRPAAGDDRPEVPEGRTRSSDSWWPPPRHRLAHPLLTDQRRNLVIARSGARGRW